MNRKKQKLATQAPPAKPITHTGALHSVGFPGFHLNKRKIILFILLILCLALQSCQNSSQHQAPAKPTLPSVLVVHVNDYSRSTSPVTYFDSSAAFDLYNAVSTAGGGCVTAIGVYEQSAMRDIYSMQVLPYPDTSVNPETNIYKAARIHSMQKKAKSKFSEDQKGACLSYLRQTSKPHDAPYSDLQGALDLAQMCLEQPQSKPDCRKYLLIGSDMVNNIKGKGHVPLKPVPLTGVTVLIVRPSLSAVTKDQLSALFPGSQVYVFSDIHDAIRIISQSNF